MGYDAMASAPASIPRDLAKKKRGNRTAKMKQCKLDARREQWLSQVNKEPKASGSLTVTSPPPNPPLPQAKKTKSKREEREQSNDSVFLHEMSDSDSPSQCASPHTSNNDRPISSGSSVGCSSRSVSDPDEEEINHREEEEEEENDVLDDWEAVADALTSHSNEQDIKFSYPPNTLTEPPVCPVTSQVDSVSTKTQPVRVAPRAWRPDDAFRPQSLPSISKQLSFPSMNRHFGISDQKGILSLPSSCPICYEDLDSTDSSFLPCLCGFRLCLFCHKRILEADARCPGCRKKYENVPSGAPVEANGSVSPLPMWETRLSRSCSVNSRY